ncbi:MAG: ABC transporter substrate-binding protein [Burkholderiales bacterium]
MIDRRRFLVLAAALPSAAIAQPAELVWRVGFCTNGFPPPDGLPPVAMRRALREQGYVEGRNVAYVGRWAELKPERLPVIAKELAELKPNAIVALGYPPADALRQATTSIPIVVCYAGDPVAMGLVASFARPGANVTGISDQSAELSAKRMEILKQVRPNATRVAVLWNARNASMTHRFREIERAAGVLSISVQPLAVREPADFDAAFAAMAREHPDVLLVVTDALTASSQGRVTDYAAKNDLPAVYESGAVVRNGGLMSYGPKPDDIWRRVAVYVDRIVKGARPADLPVEQPNEFELVINMKTAKSLGIAIPPALFMRADEVIQ